MKLIKNIFKELLLLGVILAISGCSGGDDASNAGSQISGAGAPASAEEPLSKDPIKAFQLGMAAYNQKDWKKLFRLFPEKVEWLNITALGTVIKGSKLLARQFIHERNAFPDCQFGLDSILMNTDGDLAVKGVFRGTHRGVLSTFKPTGKTVSYDVFYLVEMEKGVANRVFVYSNLATLLRQIGAIKKDGKKRPEWPTKVSVTREPGKDANKRVVEKFYTLWKEGNFEGIKEILAPQVVVNNRAVLSSYKSIAEVTNYLENEHESFKKLRHQHDKLSTAGDFVISPVIKRGVLELAIKTGVAPQAKTVAIPVLHLFKVVDEKVVSLDIYYDELQIFKQFGIPAHMALNFINQRDLGVELPDDAKELLRESAQLNGDKPKEVEDSVKPSEVKSIRDLKPIDPGSGKKP